MGWGRQESPKWGRWDAGSRGKVAKKSDLGSCILCGYSCILQLFIRNSVYATGSFGGSEADTVLIDKDILSAAHLLWDAEEQPPCCRAIGGSVSLCLFYFKLSSLSS